MDRIIQIFEKYTEDYLPTGITRYLIFGQIAAFVATAAYPAFRTAFILQGDRILNGQWWLLITYLFQPLSESPLFAAFVWYIFYLYGTVLEKRLGTAKYVFYILIAYVANALVALLFPSLTLTNGYLYTSLFLAFAFMFPNFQLLLFFVLPVKIKWLALITAGTIGLTFLASAFPTKVLIVASFSNFLLFFGKDLLDTVRGNTIDTPIMKEKKPTRDPYHVCYVCKTNELDNPDMQIRYCSTCKPTTCYCGEHINGHTHRGL
ncbi:MAG: rhomboid family intramembrane serine protease [Caldilineaceae bacterium]|nr:rhomboid family intramembrane serine protease [Caldilineaceae bacterium]